ncbi:MAG: SMP-30/gluconolactonase/LRE family protein [Candidatus Thiodiazotropha sp. (ex Notomyrtea botanica)]|nr:SMP-30/gluconolactonase/LRE family protein [Candidatus Thiodiazotropha sp. (ex Notomyrtea botanica)]
MIIILMGVSGSGKTTIGRQLATTLGWRFVEGDDYHSLENRAKMAAAIPLDDNDRQPWLARLSSIIDKHIANRRDAVVSCSALKRQYQAQLVRDPAQVHIVHLHGSFDLIRQRLKSRKDHFMRPELLQSQFDALERPEDEATVMIDQSPAAIVTAIRDSLHPIPASHETRVLLDQLMFPEAPRWRDGWLWFTDQHARQIIRVNPHGESDVVATLDDLPGGLGWLPDARLLVVSMTQRQLLVLQDSTPEPYADLSTHASFHCNDMLVDLQGRAYVGNFGFDLHGGEAERPAELILVEPNRLPRQVAEGLVFPNGCALTSDGSTLLVAETFASRITAFDIEADGGLSHRRVWAELDDAYPDGIALDPAGDLWVAAPNLSRLLLVREGGEILRSLTPWGDPYACMLGGEDGNTLFITSAETDDPELAKSKRSGRIEMIGLEAFD